MTNASSNRAQSRVDQHLHRLRQAYRRVAPGELADEVASGSLVIDTRPVEQRDRDGDLPGAVVIDRNVLEWRLDPTSAHRVPEADNRRTIIVCNQGYSSTLAVASLMAIGLSDVTDLEGGFQALLDLGVL